LVEFEEPIADPTILYFARVLAYAPDPLLTYANVDQFVGEQEDPPLAIDPELMRVITHDRVTTTRHRRHAGNGGGNRQSGGPMIMLSPVHYLLPLPPGLHNESNELLGFLLRTAGRAFQTESGQPLKSL